MNYLKLPHMDSPVSVFAICQAHQQLEADYNVGGWLRERPSNRRRMESTSSQLHRMGYSSPFGWVRIVPEVDEETGEYEDDPCEDLDDNDVRDIYLINVLKWGLPMDDEMRAFIAQRYTPEFLNTFPSWSEK